MNTTRNRKPHGKLQKRVSFAVDEDKEHRKKSLIQMVYRHKYKFILVCLLILLIALNFWPPPELSRHAKHWHDSGYIFKFQGYNIFYQDILRIQEPLTLTPVLLILHGFPTSSYDWKDLVPHFHERFSRVIIPDMLGLGFSDKPVDHQYSVKEQATIQEQLLHYLNITEVHILAHDYGDTVAQELLARSNDLEYHLDIRIKSLCLTNGGIIPSQHKPRPIQKVLMMPVMKRIMSYLTNWFLFKSRFSSIFGPNTQPSKNDLNDFYAILLYKKGHLVLPEILQYIQERHANEKRWVSALQDTNMPLHLIYGPLDPVNTPDGFLKTYKDIIVQSTVTVLENVGHYPQMEDEFGFKKSYNMFLKRIEENYYVL